MYYFFLPVVEPERPMAMSYVNHCPGVRCVTMALAEHKTWNYVGYCEEPEVVNPNPSLSRFHCFFLLCKPPQKI